MAKVSYADYQAASGFEAALIPVNAFEAAGAELTANWTKPGQLTYKSLVARLGQAPYKYPADQIQDLINLAWPVLPANFRNALSAKKPATAPALPPKSMPVTPSNQFPASHPAHTAVHMSTGEKVAIGVGVSVVGLKILSMFLGRKRG